MLCPVSVGRHATTAVTLLVLCGLVAAGAWWGWQQMTSALPSSNPDAAPSCPTQVVDQGAVLRASQVRVSVFNAGHITGLASNTMEALVQRGFRSGETGNAPSDMDVSTVKVWTTHADDAAAELVALQFGKDTPVAVTDRDLGPGVDVVVGGEFDGLAKDAPTTLTAKGPEQVCAPASGTPVSSPSASPTASSSGQGD